MKIVTMILVFLSLTTLTSCDCADSITGTVIDAQTNQPIYYAFIFKENMKFVETTTDQKGSFLIKNDKCQPMKLEVIKDGYQTCLVEIESGDTMKIKLYRKANN